MDQNIGLDITSYLIGKEASGGGGGGGDVTPHNIDEFNVQYRNLALKYMNYLNSLVDNYTPYLNESITIYSPNENAHNFMIQKRNDGKYRIVWMTNNNGFYIYVRENTQIFTTAKVASSEVSNYHQNFDSYYFGLVTDTQVTAGSSFYSNNFNTLDDLIEALKSPAGANITYTEYKTGRSFAGVSNSEWPCPITNLPLFEREAKNPIINGRILSKNLTISTIS